MLLAFSFSTGAVLHRISFDYMFLIFIDCFYLNILRTSPRPNTTKIINTQQPRKLF